MSSVQGICAALGRFRSPAGDCVTMTSYRQYVLRILREELTMDEIAELLGYFRCSIEEVTDKVVERMMQRLTRPKVDPRADPRPQAEAPLLRDLRSQVDALTSSVQFLINSQQDTAGRVLAIGAGLEALGRDVARVRDKLGLEDAEK